MIRRLVMAFGLMVLWAGHAAAQESELPCSFPRHDVLRPVLRAKVTPVTGGFDYVYHLENQPASPLVLDMFAIEGKAATGRLTQVAPAPWDGDGVIVNTDYYIWNIWRVPGLSPGAAASGFGFRQAPLPAVVTFLAWGDTELPSFPEGMAPESCEGDDVVENSFKGKTVGPKARPATIAPLDLLNQLIALVHESRRQVWIKLDGNHQSLLAKLVAAKRAMEDGLDSTAKLQIGAFVNEVQATACQDFTCGTDLPLTSEAYALLYYNGQYLYDQLPRPGRQ